MYVPAREFALSDGSICVMKSPTANDAKNMVNYLKEVAKETPYMIRYIDEIEQSRREWPIKLKNASEQEGVLYLCVFFNQKIVANGTICHISTYRKVRHRASISIAVLEEMWHKGIGTTLLHELVGYAKKMRYSQIELEVACSNIRAISLYLGCGFQIYGRRNHAYKIDGIGLIDEYLMYRQL